MTARLLHQAAQKAVEALKRLTDGRGGIAHFARTTEQAGNVRDLIAALESALQQQPEPVAPKNPLRDEAYDQIDRHLRNNLDDADYADYSQALDLIYTTAAPPALQHQEEPREPVAWIRWCSDGGYEGPIMNHSMEEVRKRSGAWTPLYASPSTTRQQEVVSGWKLVPETITEEMHVAAVRTAMRCSGNDDFPRRVWRAMIAAAPSTPEKAGGVSPTFPRNVPMDPQAMRERAAGVPGTEGGA